MEPELYRTILFIAGALTLGILGTGTVYGLIFLYKYLAPIAEIRTEFAEKKTRVKLHNRHAAFLDRVEAEQKHKALIGKVELGTDRWKDVETYDGFR
jgi:hypothetical protein